LRYWLGGSSKLFSDLWYGRFNNRRKWLAGNTVEKKQVATFADLRNAFAHYAIFFYIKQQYRAGAVVVPDIVMGLLKVPAIFASVYVQCEDRHGEQIIAFTYGSILIG